MESRSLFNRNRVWNVCAAVVVMGFSLSWVVQESFHRSYLYTSVPGVPTDFPHYYMAGRLAKLKPPENLLYYPPVGHTPRSYMDLRIDDTTPYGNPSSVSGLPRGFVTRPFDASPFAALLMAPLASFPWQAAYFLWQLLCVLLMVASVYSVLYLSHDAPPSSIEVAIAITVLFLFLPFNRALTLGNVDVVLFFLWAVGVHLLRRGQTIGSASCFALGTAIKLSPIFALPLLAMRRQWRWLAYYVVASAVVLAVSVWKVGWQNHVLWAGQVAPALACGIKTFWNRSLPGFIFGLADPHGLLTDLPGPQGLCLFNKIVSSIIYFAFLVWCWRERRDSKGLVYEIIVLPLIVLLMSPMTWSQYYVLAVLPLSYFWVRSREQGDGASTLDLVLLTCCTLIFGSALPEFAARALGPKAELFLMGTWVAATMALIWIGTRMYGSAVRDGLQPLPAPVSAALVDH